jgi:hypothetical protein
MSTARSDKPAPAMRATTISGVTSDSPIRRGTSTNLRYDVEVGRAASTLVAEGYASRTPSLIAPISVSLATWSVEIEKPP